jgi:two-component system CheB/CheR fusion protein
MESLLNRLATHYGVNFKDYHPTLIGRLRRRMNHVRIDDFLAYERYLLTHAEEYALLSRRLFVGYTTFFRDPPVWDELVNRILPDMLLLKAADAPIRIWCVGCSSGEEAYTLAISTLETIGEERFERDVRIYATDIDVNNVKLAREGVYSADRLQVMEVALRDKYFTARADAYVIRPDLRRSLIFGSHNVLNDPPFLRVDVLVCRNTLMYFNAAAQRRVMKGFCRAVGKSGCLILGTGDGAPDRRLFTADRRRLGLYSATPPAIAAGVTFRPAA